MRDSLALTAPALAMVLTHGCASSDTATEFRCFSMNPSARETTMCRAGQICVRPCCGGQLPPCQAELDGGTCPPGTSRQGLCNGSGCGPPPCTPDPAYCVELAAAERARAACSGMRDGNFISCLCY